MYISGRWNIGRKKWRERDGSKEMREISVIHDNDNVYYIIESCLF